MSGPRGSAKDRALRLLGVRWRSRHELKRRLTAAGFEHDEIEAALHDLEEVGLVDDVRFARELVRDRAEHRLSGDRAIQAALREKGVAADLAGQALEAAGSEAERARALAAQRAPRMASLDPQAAFRRLFGLLARRGFGPGLAREASEEALRSVFSPGSIADDEG
jgi:regulatory protein